YSASSTHSPLHTRCLRLSRPLPLFTHIPYTTLFRSKFSRQLLPAAGNVLLSNWQFAYDLMIKLITFELASLIKQKILPIKNNKLYNIYKIIPNHFRLRQTNFAQILCRIQLRHCLMRLVYSKTASFGILLLRPRIEVYLG